MYVFYSFYALKKKNDFPASVTSFSDSHNFFYNVKLDCFSYAGTHDFSSLTSGFFNTVTNIYVSNNYPASTFAGKSITGKGQTCGVSKSHLETPNTGINVNNNRRCKISVCYRRNNISFHHYMLLLIQS